MHIRGTLSVCLLLSLFTSTQADAQFRPPSPTPPGESFHVELGLMFWYPSPGIIIGNDELNVVTPGGVDFVREFEIPKKRFNEFRATLKAGKSKVRISHIDLHYLQAATLQRTIVFGGQTFNVDAAAAADLKWEIWRLAYERDLVATPHGLFGVVFGANFNHVVADLRATSAGATVSSLTDENVPVPALGIVGRVYPHKNVSITAEYTGFKMPGYLARLISDSDDADAHVRDFDIYVTGSFTRYLGAQLGYRNFSADYHLDTDIGDLEMKGLYFGGMVRF